MKSYYRTDFLFSKSSFLIGFGSILGIFAPLYTYNTSETEREADYMAIESDFGTIGKDLMISIEKFSNAKRQ